MLKSTLLEKEPAAGSEKRKHPRFSVDLPIQCYKLGSLVKHDAKAIDVSEGGLLFYFSELLPIGLLLRLKLTLPSWFSLSAIKTVAEVAWTDIQLKEGCEGYRIGVRFLDVSAKDMRRLKKLLLKLSQSTSQRNNNRIAAVI